MKMLFTYGFKIRFSFALVLFKKSTLSFSEVDLATTSVVSNKYTVVAV